MDLNLIIIFLFSILAGTIGAILGIGGGIIIVPMLISLGIDIKFAIPASLLAIFFNSLTSTIIYSNKKIVNFSLGLKVGILGITGALLGSYTFLIIDKKILYFVFSIITIILAIFILNKEKIIKPRKIYFLIFLGGGYISNLLGVGGGILFTPVLHVLFNLSLKESVATSLLAIGFVTFVGIILYSIEKFIALNVAIPAILGIIMGAYIGSKIMLKIKEIYQKTLVLILLTIISIYMIIKAIF